MSDKKSVLIVTERFYPEDFGINDLAQAWQEHGFKVEVLCQTPSYPFDKVFEGYNNRIYQKESWKGIKIHRVYSLLGYKKNVMRKIGSYLSFALFASFFALLFGRKYDKIFVYHVGPLTQAIPAILIKKIFRKELYIWTLDIWPDSVFAYGFKKNKLSVALLDFYVSFVYRNCTSIFVSCKGFKDKIISYAPKAKIIFSPQWVPLELEVGNPNPNEKLKAGYNFTFAGNIGKVQNLENVINGFALIDKSVAHIDQDINLNIVGDGSNLQNLKNLVAEHNISNVHFWGRRPLSEMTSWFAGSDALIISLIDQPIFSLTVPAKFQAYLAAGKPIICIMKGEVAAIVKEKKIGLVSDPNDLEEIRQTFEAFVSIQQKELTQMTTNMTNLLNIEYNRDKIIQQKTEEVFI